VAALREEGGSLVKLNKLEDMRRVLTGNTLATLYPGGTLSFLSGYIRQTEEMGGVLLLLLLLLLRLLLLLFASDARRCGGSFLMQRLRLLGKRAGDDDSGVWVSLA
jgi:hypothetical protein